MSIGQYRYAGLLFGVVLAGDTFQKKIDEIFKQLPNVLALLMMFGL